MQPLPLNLQVHTHFTNLKDSWCRCSTSDKSKYNYKEAAKLRSQNFQKCDKDLSFKKLKIPNYQIHTRRKYILEGNMIPAPRDPTTEGEREGTSF